MRYGIPRNAAVVRVHYSQFKRGESLAHQRMECRTLCWCKSGKGELRVNDAVYRVSVDDYVFLPWGHAVEYQADTVAPFLLGSVHIVPQCAKGHPIEDWVAHHPGDHLSDCPWRKDAPLPGLEDTLVGTFSLDVRLGHLAEYTVQRMLFGEWHDRIARQLAHLLIEELYHSLEALGPDTQGISAELQRLVVYICDHIDERLALQELTDFSGLSRSTIGRLFRRNLRCTPVEWILRRRMHVARRYLCTTRLPIWKVGCKVGIEDQFYFSKVFKKAYGVSPLKYRETHGII